MGKKRTVQKKGGGFDSEMKARALSRVAKKNVKVGLLYIQSTYNNTQMVLTDLQGNTLCWGSSGTLGFKGTRKGTPYAAAKVGEVMGERAQIIGLKSVSAVMKGIGAGRESSLRAFAGKGIDVTSIRDETPRPFNGPRAPRPRRV